MNESSALYSVLEHQTTSAMHIGPTARRFQQRGTSTTQSTLAPNVTLYFLNSKHYANSRFTAQPDDMNEYCRGHDTTTTLSATAPIQISPANRIQCNADNAVLKSCCYMNVPIGIRPMPLVFVLKLVVSLPGLEHLELLLLFKTA